ncbi:hypothetical protein O6H91_07G004600 [Diphasiastrum complanatum]|uniref:Uncharacterized protein n=1 Tax=Diphasiastrum complanatum TaxID=34168 RepID=A0ACC2D1W6_DIPCM|nr:hypothetical protein O6H91_07G004600 [Diphasiastrum complanatum]
MGNEFSTGHGGGRNQFSAGSETELIRIEAAQLFLIDEEESVLLLQAGMFALNLTKQGHSSLAAVDALVGDVHWPVAKDSPVCRIREGWYLFSIPGVLYALIFSDTTSLEDLQELESLLLEYSLFEVRSDFSIAGLDDIAYMRQIPKSRDKPGGDCTVGNGFELTGVKVVHSISRESTVLVDSISRSSEWASSSIQTGSARLKSRTTGAEATGMVEISPQMKLRVQRARRMSAVTKLIAKTLMKGAISASNHIGSSLSAKVSSSAPVRGIRKTGMDSVALASVDACVKVVNAVETAGKSVLRATSTAGSDLVHHKYGGEAGELAQKGFGAMGNVVNTLWTLNKLGLRMLVTVIATSTVINVARQNAALGSSSNDAVNKGDLSPESSNLHRHDTQLLTQDFESRDSNKMGENE